MNYSSISDWYDYLQSMFHNWPAWGIIAPDAQASTAESRVAAMAANGLHHLQEVEAISSQLEAEDLSDIWWLSQALKKFRIGCTADPVSTLDAWHARNACALAGSEAWFKGALGHSNAMFHYRMVRGMRRLLERALPEIPDTDIDGRFGPGSVNEGWDVAQRWENISSFSYDIRTMNLVRSASNKVPACELGELTCRPTCVPKDYSKFRLITVEPAENSFGQQWVRSLLLASIHQGPLRGTVMDLSNFSGDPVEKQRRRCLEASRKAHLATLDLSDASDCISWEAVAQVFPIWVVALLERFRTPRFSYVRPTTDKSLRARVDGEMHMYAGMGNATTFVVETLFFWACVTTLRDWLRADHEHVTVFGDDIICGNATANHPLFEPALRQLGLVLNRAKCGCSLNPGFRESCGLVAHSGYQLVGLNRIYGYDTSTVSGRVDLCAYATRCQWPTWRTLSPYDVTPSSGSQSRIQSCALAVGWDLAERLIKELEVPNIRHLLGEEGLWAHCPHLPFSDVRTRFQCAKTESTRQDRRPAYQRLEYFVVVRRGVQKHRVKRNLSPSLALGVLRGQITDLKTCKRRTIIPIAVRQTRCSQAWVPAIL